MKIEKKIQDGKVAVLYSPGFGAGWSSWNSGSKDFVNFLIFDRTLVEMSQNKAHESDVLEYIQAKFPEEEYIAMNGWKDVQVAWIGEGVAFQIREYDGSEQIIEYNPGDYFTA